MPSVSRAVSACDAELIRADETDLQDLDDRVVVDADDLVVSLGAPADQRGVHDVGEQEEQDPHARDAMGDPRQLSGQASLVEGSELGGTLGHVGSSPV